MLTIDQARIDAPEFPRSAEWWRRFVPEWADVTVYGDGTVTIGAVTEALPPRGPDRVAAARRNRNREEAIVRWLLRLPQLEPAIVEEAGERCPCWRQPARLHSGHCCFTDARVCHSMPEDMRKRAS